jgi:hypothetical protein
MITDRRVATAPVIAHRRVASLQIEYSFSFPYCVTLQQRLREKSYVLEFAAKLLGGPSCYPIGQVVELLTHNGPSFQLGYSFLTL